MIVILLNTEIAIVIKSRPKKLIEPILASINSE